MYCPGLTGIQKYMDAAQELSRRSRRVIVLAVRVSCCVLNADCFCMFFPIILSISNFSDVMRFAHESASAHYTCKSVSQVSLVHLNLSLNLSRFQGPWLKIYDTDVVWEGLKV